MNLQHQQKRICLIFFTLLLFTVNQSNAANWRRFRGENGTGISSEKGIPVQWTPKEYKWDIELPDFGHSSPVVFDESLFITSAQENGSIRTLFCIDAVSGKTRWQRTIGMNKNRKHSKGSWASSTPTTDGKFVYVVFADEERCLLSAYDYSGNLVWRRATVSNEQVHGQGVSPILFDGLVILPGDKEGPSSFIAYDALTGKTVWSTLRSVRRTSYATPFILNREGKKPQLITASGAMGIASLNPYTGKTNWLTEELPLRTVASPIFGDGLIFQTCGGGGRGKLLIGVNPDALETSDPQVKTPAYTLEKNLPYVPTPVFYDHHLYLWCDNGVVSCVEFPAGKNIWTKRVGGKYSGSPVCIDGKLYCITENGIVMVIAASPKYQFLGKTTLGDPSHATPVVAGGRLYLRTFHRLKCIEKNNYSKKQNNK